jgi:uncharacterized protein
MLTNFNLLRCFPDALQATAFDVVELATRGKPETVQARLLTSAKVGGEMLDYPSRLYVDSRQLNDAMVEWPGVRRQIALCLGTRHHDGFLRESCLRRLGVPDAEWKLPFVVLLLGDYVIEIANLAAALLAAAPHEMVQTFVERNGPLIQTQRRRAISYWDCYYRSTFAHYQLVPAVRCIDEHLLLLPRNMSSPPDAQARPPEADLGPIAAVMVYVSDIAAAAAWYMKVFPDAVRSTIRTADVECLSIGEVLLELVRADDKVSSGPSGTVVYWQVANFEAALLRFRHLGAALYRGPMRIEEGLSMCQLRDPWGNCIGLRGPSAVAMPAD